MSNDLLDRSSILKGTVKKSLGLAYQAMSENYTKETAENFYYEYCTLPLSIILEQSRKIFSDFYYGYDFYRELVENDLIPPTRYDTEIAKVENLLTSISQGYYKDSEMYEKVVSLKEALVKQSENRTHLIGVLERFEAFRGENGEDFSTLFFDQLFELSQDPEDYADQLENLISVVYGIKQPILVVAFGYLLAIHEESALPYLYEYTRIPLNYQNSPKTDENLTLTESWIYKSRMIELTIAELMKDVDTVTELEKANASPEMIELWKTIGSKDLSGQKLFTESAMIDSFQRIREKLVQGLMDKNSIDSPIAMSSFFEDEDVDLRMQLLKYDNTCNAMAFEEAALDFLKSSPNFESVCENYETHDDIWCGLWADKQAFMEWESDGRPNAVFRSRIKTHTELKKQKEGKEDEKTSMKKELDEEIEKKEDITKRNKAFINRVKKEISNVKRKETKEGRPIPVNERINNGREALREFREEITNFQYGTVELRDKVDELEREIDKLKIAGPKAESAEDCEFDPLDFLRKDTFDMYMEAEEKKSKGIKDAIKDKFGKSKKKKNEKENSEETKEKEEETKDEKEVKEKEETDKKEKEPEEKGKEEVKEEKEKPEKDKKEDEKEKEEENTEKTNPVEKPKEDLPTKIQNKALDHSAKQKEKDAEKMEKKQKIKNAANAVSEKPKEKLDDIKRFGRKWEKWDDNARKEFMLKPGNRHKIMKKFRTALLYGATAHIKLSYLPVVVLLRHFSKSKDRRIRNELSMELDSEIKICEEKIRDADNNMDRQKKYELMRIKDKLNAERTRVRVNAKYL